MAATTVVVNGSNYSVPGVGDKNWGQNVTDLLIALAVATPGNSGYINYVSVTSSPITVVSGRTYLVNTTSARTLNLPAPAANAFLHVKDITGSAGSNNITIARNGSETIDGVAGNKTLALNYGSWFIMSDGTNWWTYNDDNRRVMLANDQTIAGVKTFSSAPVFSAGATAAAAITITPTTNQLVLGTTRTVTINAPTPASTSRVVTLPDLSGDYSVIGTIGAQTITGGKTFANQTLILQEDGGANVVTIAVASLAADRLYTIPESGGAADFVMNQGTQTIAGSKTFSSAVAITPTTNQIVLGVTNTVTITAPAPAASRVLTIPDPGAAASFVLTEGAQTIAGIFTFTAAPVISGANIKPRVTQTSTASAGWDFYTNSTQRFSIYSNETDGFMDLTSYTANNGWGFRFYTTPAAGSPTLRLRIPGSGQLLAHAGSASAPVYSFDAGSTDGMYSPGAQTLGFCTNGVQRLLIENTEASFNFNSVQRFKIDQTAVAGNTAMLVYDVDNATIERVSVGAADSGGAGFKVLRIPN